MPQLELIDVSKTFTLDGQEVSAVQGASLAAEKGEFISIMGHSGSGKTTLLSMTGGILKPTSGKILFDRTDLYCQNDDALSEYRARKIGYVFQFASLMPVLTAKENLLLPTIFAPNGRGKDHGKKAEDYLALVGLADKANAYPGQLSGGQQRRVAIVRALMNDPELLLADEPTGDLDEETEAEIMGLFRRINSEMGITFILVTHSTELAGQAQRKFRMTHGRLDEVS